MYIDLILAALSLHSTSIKPRNRLECPVNKTTAPNIHHAMRKVLWGQGEEILIRERIPRLLMTLKVGTYANKSS